MGKQHVQRSCGGADHGVCNGRKDNVAGALSMAGGGLQPPGVGCSPWTEGTEAWVKEAREVGVGGTRVG